jgi:anti-anti-sigma factor
MQLNAIDKGEYLALTVSGRLDASNSASFDESAKALLNPPSKSVLVDLAGLEYISSSGLRSLLSLAKAVRKAGFKTAFCSLQPAPEEIFRIAGFMEILTFRPDEKSAAKEL